MKSSKLQHSSTRETSITKLQSITMLSCIEVWKLEFLWSLVLGIWMFESRHLDSCNKGFGRASRRRERGAGVVRRAGLLQEIFVAADVGRHLAGVDVQHLGREMADEMHIMRNEDQRAFVSLQRERERLNRVDVEVRGRFVHQQQVRRIHEELDEIQPAFFTAAQNFRQLVNVVLAEHEGTQHGAGLVLAHFWGTGQNFVEHGLLRVERGGAMLAEITDLGVVAEVAFAFLKFHRAGENFDQRGFARAVRPDEHGAFAAFNGQVQAGINYVRPVSHVDAFQRDGALSAARGRRDLKTKRLARRERFLDLLHPFDLLELALRLRRLRRNGAEAVGKGLQVGDFLLLIFVGGELLVVTLLALAQEIG